MKNTMLLFIFSLITLISCETAEIENVANQTLVGEWRYVNTFSTTSSNKCYDCPNFDYEKSIYKITFDENGTFSGRINLLIISGKYTLNEVKQATNAMNANLAISEIKVLNKPMQTEEDTRIYELFTAGKSLILENITTNKTYDFLSVYTGGNDYLFFVRKK